MKYRLPLLAAQIFLTFIQGFAPGSATAEDTVGVPWTGPAGTTESIAQIMAREKQLSPKANAAARETHRRLMAPEPKPADKGGGEAEGLTAVFVPPGQNNQPANLPSGPFSPQVVGTGFLGAQLSESGYIPPDSMGAVGPSQFLVCVNGRIKVFDKNGNLGPLNTTTDSFFNSVRSAGTSDPHVRYDRLSGRWFITMIDVATVNRVLIAVSSGPTITGAASFTFFQFQHDLVGATPNADTGQFADYDTLGVDANALYIGVNVFGSSFVGTTGFVVNKANLLGGTLTVTAFRQLATGSTAGPYTPQGVDNDDPAATEGYFIGPDTTVFSRIVLRRISNPGGLPSISGNLNVATPSTSSPIDQVHKDSTGKNLDALDYRLFAAHIKKNKLTGISSLWTAHNIRVNSSGVGTSVGKGGRNGSRWYELRTLTGTPTLFQSGTLFDSASSNPKGFWIPSVAANGQGHMALGCSYAGNNDYAGVAVAGRLSGDALGATQSPTLAVVSSTAYNLSESPNPHRWGDYSQVTVDPNDDMTLWTVQEYCNATDSWGVRVVQLKAPPPATPATASPAAVLQGQSSVNVVVTGTSASGSGFFDPGPDPGGPGFSNHLAAAANGGGVTVNSVTFSNATNITLNVTIAAGATAGARTITVTNPDGQVATSASGILTINATAPVADFAGGPTNGAWPLGVSFTNLSTGATNYSWVFGDGNTSTATNAANTYTTAGSYTVKLTAVGAGGTNSLTRANYIVVTNPPLVANFEGGPTNGAAPLTVYFTNLSTGATNCDWDFGDGHVSTNSNPTNIYSSQGSYTVSLTAIGVAGTNTLVRNNYVVLSNAPPVLAPVADQVVLEETLLTFTASASDPDVGQTLAFSLDAGTPEGASINATNGVFTWTPSLAYASTTNSITVRVTDDGSPAASDAQAVNVIVVAKPRLLGIAEAPDGFFTLAWQVYPGRTYRFEYKTNLTDTVWTTLGPDFTAATSSAATTNDAGANLHGFYRVLDVTGP
jgi:PKD repeat protein